MAIGLILARGGSISIPMKNIAPINGRPLIYYMLDALSGSGCLKKVYVATDDNEIAVTVRNYGSEIVEIFNRNPINAQSDSSSEDAIIEFLNYAKIPLQETLVFAQATSPLTKPSDIAQAFDKFQKSDCDSLLSVVRQKRFIWSDEGKPINYSPDARPRRQDFNGFLVENGAFYISGVSEILESKSRVSGRVIFWEMPEETYFEIDEPSDLDIVSALISQQKPSGILRRNIKLFVSDIDGTLTDGGMYYSSQGEMLKKFNTRDGMAFELLSKQGILTALITSENSDINIARSNKLNIDYLIQGKKGEGKLRALENLCGELNIDLSNVAYVGDDMNCIEVLRAVGVAACPSDSSPVVLNDSNVLVLKKAGGRGAVREFVDSLIK